MTIVALSKDSIVLTKTYYSIGGGFILDHEHIDNPLEVNAAIPPKYKFDSADELLVTCRLHGLSIAKLMYENERQLNTDEVINKNYYSSMTSWWTVFIVVAVMKVFYPEV